MTLPDEFRDGAALEKTLSREKAKDVTLDYAERRGIEPQHQAAPERGHADRAQGGVERQGRDLRDGAERYRERMKESAARGESSVERRLRERQEDRDRGMER